MNKRGLTRQLLALGVKPGGVLLVHTSFRASRPVEVVRAVKPGG